jgi:hypothetical protein
MKRPRYVGSPAMVLGLSVAGLLLIARAAMDDLREIPHTTVG